MASLNPSVPSIGQLRDLPLKVPLDESLVRAIDGFFATPAQPMESAEALVWVNQALRLTEQSVRALDDMNARLTTDRISAPNPSALQQKRIQGPRREVEQTLTALKTHIQAERQAFARRFDEQRGTVEGDFSDVLAPLAVESTLEGERARVKLSAAFERAYRNWRSDLAAAWINRWATILPERFATATNDDFVTLAKLLGRKPLVSAPVVEPPTPPVTDWARQCESVYEAITPGTAMMESFKGGLNTVAMLAGMVVIPVVGSLMHTSPMGIRAAVMGGLLVPIGGFAVVAGRKYRVKLEESEHDKARTAFRKTLQADLKTWLDRFRALMLGMVDDYAEALLSRATKAIEPMVEAEFAERERLVAREIADAQVSLDGLSDTLNAVKMARNAITNGLLVDLRRKQQDLAAGRG